MFSFGRWYYTATKPLTTEQATTRDQSIKLAEQVMDEGAVLLKNEDSVLPLQENKLSIFGIGSVKTVYGGGGAGGIAGDSVDTFYEALDQSSIDYDKDLYNLYSNYSATGKISLEDYKKPGKNIINILLPNLSGFIQSSPVEMPADNISDEILNKSAEFSDTALYVVSRVGMEASDQKVEDLRLSDDEKKTLDKLDEKFDHIVLLVNATNVMELGFVDDYKNIDSVLWIGAPGQVGSHSIAKMLKGEVNPSGRLTDTYAYDLESNPAVLNTGDFQYKEDGEGVRRYFQNNEESIYVGYRYYETFTSEADYDLAVQYPFGYGLSYTDFTWQIESTEVKDGKITAKVKVTNTGKVAGKDVVQLYYEPPYTTGGIEKSAIVLGGYAKTKTIQPEESETVTVSFNVDDMASYDDETAKTWVLEAGDYGIKIAKNVHEFVDEFSYSQAETLYLDTDNTTGETVTNRFDDSRGDLTYLSRSDPEATAPSAPSGDDYNLPEGLYDYDYVHEKSDAEVPTMGVDNQIKLKDLKGLDYDDPKWNKFLDQFTDNELVSLAGNGGYWTIAIDRLGIPRTSMYDGPASIRSFIGSWASVAYPTPVNLSATWNDELAQEVGEAMGNEAQSYDIDAVYAPSLNLHRSPLGGRNFEYYSEDPLIAGKIGAAYTKGVQSTGTVAVMKHFAGNEQETNRANYGLYVWTTEQSLRELYLKPFKLAVKEGGANGAMSAFNRIGPIWAGGNKALLTDVLRTEWGFEGFVITDAGIAGQGDHFNALQAVEAGNDLMLYFLIDTPGDNTFEKQLKDYLKEDRAGTLQALRKSAHNICYYVLQTNKL